MGFAHLLPLKEMICVDFLLSCCLPYRVMPLPKRLEPLFWIFKTWPARCAASPFIKRWRRSRELSVRKWITTTKQLGWSTTLTRLALLRLWMPREMLAFHQPCTMEYRNNDAGHRHPWIRIDVPAVRTYDVRGDAYGLLQILPRMCSLSSSAASKSWRLLCLLFLWVGEMSVPAVAGQLLWSTLRIIPGNEQTRLTRISDC